MKRFIVDAGFIVDNDRAGSDGIHVKEYPFGKTFHAIANTHRGGYTHADAQAVCDMLNENEHANPEMLRNHLRETVQRATTSYYKKKFTTLAKAARPIFDDEEGSERQVNAEVAFFDAVRDYLPRAEMEKLQDDTFKATSNEKIDLALKAVGIKVKS